MRAAKQLAYLRKRLFPPYQGLRRLWHIPHRFRKLDCSGVASSKPYPLNRCDDVVIQRRLFPLASIDHYSRLAVVFRQAFLEGFTFNPHLTHWPLEMPGKVMRMPDMR